MTQTIIAQNSDQADSNDSEIETALLDSLSNIISNRVNTYLRFYYDNAGNIIKKERYTSLRENTQDEAENESFAETLFDNYNISIKTDVSWNNVSISILGDLESSKSSLSIYNMYGVNCYTLYLRSNYMTINLSTLPKGIYLFYITIDGTTVTKKLIKHQ